MTQSVNSDSITADLCITYSTVDYLVVATGVLTIGSHVVLNDGLACGVTQSGNNLLRNENLISLSLLLLLRWTLRLTTPLTTNTKRNSL